MNRILLIWILVDCKTRILGKRNYESFHQMKTLIMMVPIWKCLIMEEVFELHSKPSIPKLKLKKQQFFSSKRFKCGFFHFFFFYHHLDFLSEQLIFVLIFFSLCFILFLFYSFCSCPSLFFFKPKISIFCFVLHLNIALIFLIFFFVKYGPIVLVCLQFFFNFNFIYYSLCFCLDFFFVT